ncbi:hypothetical protein [Haloactinopolyspora sp.]|uniref:hypothetical protein n=1 Tax=Haloactinopolyspora sp. TaxID=1966353 RepID=UPI00260DC115|nr:hypothetical protein [Haloactinopolyspora sp.]
MNRTTSDGIRWIDPDGTITTTLRRDTDEGDTSIRPAELAIGPGDDLYVMDSAHRQVLAVVRPGEMAGPFPWAPVGLASGGVLVLGVAAVFLVRRRRLDAAQTPESAQARSLA